MERTIFVLVAVALSAAQASLTYRNEYLSPSLWTQLVQLMQQANTDTGTCGPGGCYIRLDSNNLKFLREHETFIDERNPCLVYTCTASGVIEDTINCSEAPCSLEDTVTYPGICCPRCLGVRDDIECTFTNWGAWTECTKTCRSGNQARRRTFILSEGVDSVFCDGNLTEVMECNADIPCPVDCVWTWGLFSQCSATCGDGTMSRDPIITQPAEEGGKPCPPRETIPCNEGSCTVFVTFDPIDYTVTEGVDAFAVLTLVRSGVISETTMVTVTPQSGTALAGSDFTSSPITVVFFAGETIAQARVPITDDSNVEQTEHFTAVMTSTNPNVVIGDDTVTVTILDNNLFVTFDPTAYFVTEGVNAFAQLRLVRSGDLSESTTVTVTPQSGTATAGLDFTSTPIIVTFSPGDTIAQARVPITDDSNVEDTEHFTALMSTNNPNVVIGDDTATVTIEDNNVFVTFDPTAYIVTEGVNAFADLRFVRSGDLSGSTTVTVTPRSGTATAGLDFTSIPITVTFSPQETIARARVPITDDSIVEDTEHFTATLFANTPNVVIGDDTATVTILDNNVFVTFDPTAYFVTEGVNAFSDLRLVRSGDLSGSTVVTVTPRSGTATAGLDFTSTPITVTFSPQETIAQARVPITDDSIVEDTEHFTALMTSNNPNVVIGDDTATVTVQDNNVFVTFDPTTYIVTEGVNAFAQLRLVRSGDLSGSTTVTVTPQSGTAIAGSDFTSSPKTVTFSPQQTLVQVQVPITDDSIVEQTELFTATLSTNNPNVVIGDDTATVTIRDNDVHVTFDPTAYTVKEGVDAHAKLLLVRSGDLSHETTVTITPISGTAFAGTDFEPSQVQVTFLPGKTNAEALVTIIDNSVFEESEMFTAIMTTSHTNVMLGEDTAVVTILDNDPQCEKICFLNGEPRCIEEGDDRDKDCVPNKEDNCRKVYNPDQGDMDGDGVGDACDDCNKTLPNTYGDDEDYDFVEDSCDNCVYLPNHNQYNHDNDLTGDACDGDDDNDGIDDADDNCIFVPNSNQLNNDGDKDGDVCDADDDNDGIDDADDNCIFVRNRNQLDSDNDTVGDACDNCKVDPNSNQLDSDGDTVGDACDNCIYVKNKVNNKEQDPGDPDKFGDKCNTPKALLEEILYDEDYDDDADGKSSEKALVAQIMEMLMNMYYNN